MFRIDVLLFGRMEVWKVEEVTRFPCNFNFQPQRWVFASSVEFFLSRLIFAYIFYSKKTQNAVQTIHEDIDGSSTASLIGMPTVEHNVWVR